MVKQNKNGLLSASPNVTERTTYEEFVKDSIKPIGFGEPGDTVYAEIKAKFLLSLYQMIEESGPSFDIEIYANSVITDINDTFEQALPSLLSLQRSNHSQEG